MGFKRDSSVRGYKIRYKRSDSNTWISIGNVGQYTTEFQILNLIHGVKYDFGIEAYNTLGYSSELVAIYNQTPQVIFALPKITNLDMTNDNMGLNQTYSQDFIFRWDDQSTLPVNGKRFSDFSNIMKFVCMTVIVHILSRTLQRTLTGHIPLQ